MKIRNVVFDEKQGINKVVWFGSIGTEGDKKIKRDSYVEVDTANINIEKVKEYKTVEIINCLSVLKGELKTDPRFGISLLEKPTKEFLDIEILDILRTRLSLIVNDFKSQQKGRSYEVYFEVTTPEGIELNISYNYNFIA